MGAIHKEKSDARASASTLSPLFTYTWTSSDPQ
nr:hypothetical protein Iba_scaffold30768CG0010 [Ipomoea batatas]GMD00159.1 hypothetical protein Iba_chr05eCG12550 [Ipomoea batatas]GMD90493.1 hypothetical protein Iba_chr14dCG10190 [Ipomoea batatas]GME21415.1 hypothetical protein Iba_scaffold27742CG0010 [Ipomoea batatas]